MKGAAVIRRGSTSVQVCGICGGAGRTDTYLTDGGLLQIAPICPECLAAGPLVAAAIALDRLHKIETQVSAVLVALADLLRDYDAQSAKGAGR